MPIDTTGPVAPLTPGAAQVTPPAPVENPGALLDRDAFLTLLVTQLKYQDPANPADTSQLLTQSAQLTMVDRLNEIADSITAASAIDRMTLAGTMIGREISFLADDGLVHTARVDSVRFESEELTIRAGAFEVPLAAVVELAAAPLAGAAAPAARIPAAAEHDH